MAQTNAKELAKQAREYEAALVYVTLACNLRCPRCFLRDLPAERRAYSMTREQFERILARLKDQGVRLRVMHFTGGEPTLWPHLRWANRRVKEEGLAKCVRVVTNGVDRNADDYGEADIVHVSHYGAVNRADIARLKKQLGRRLRVQYTVHLPWPYEGQPPADVLPASCGCVNMAFLGDRVYRCGFGAARGAESVSVEDNFYHLLVNGHPRDQGLCRTCLSNRKLKVQYMTDLTFEWGIWDSSIGRVWSLGTKAMWLRWLYRRIFVGPAHVRWPADRTEDQG